ncbi:MAG: HAMP domain-containing histidine kinase [Leptolyngbya sp. UWPOB_LEPTO1]|uniref:sensor histidine kinase n=1 Tax=Leptolyngbya sp. UWPOB_LEPTO1 TaxID=2815653 RepID=UPI001AC5FB49|nr:HAMP domain-containing sensor histidine kinase [Leptolyngbya sp. UWPOB_LEPTO1]MBN8564860.1 HAMP domain-containing histidine kinase [Leptolyngbya sp. UWPOB_LEPTO1]
MSLRLRLFLTNVLVFVSVLLCTTTISFGYKARQVPPRLVKLEQYKAMQNLPNLAVYQNILAIFGQVNDHRTVLAISSSLLTVSALSLSLTQSILKPLRRIERIAKRFSEGDWAARISPSQIPEIRQLELTLNSIADQLQDVEERRQELIGDLAHEMGNPLTVIRGYLELLDSSEQFELTLEIKQQLHEEAERMTRLLADLRVLSSMETGGLPLRLEPFHPYPVIKRVVASFRTQGWRNECDLKLAGAGNLPKIFADCDRFKQILMNLISNALAYTPQGVVTVQIWAEREKLWIMVKDTGIGIADKDLPHVFQRFWRSDHSRHLRREGSGIGLAITERLVKAMGGQIEVESELGQGTAFKFCLPIHASIPEATRIANRQ